MHIDWTYRRSLAVAAAFASLLSTPGLASAQTKIYPAGTDCANQPTIAERLLCGRQEYRREHGLAVVQPTIVPEGSVPGSADEPNPIPTQPAPAALVPPAAQQIQSQPNTASANH
jgi:hypothetical protein